MGIGVLGPLRVRPDEHSRPRGLERLSDRGPWDYVRPDDTGALSVASRFSDVAQRREWRKDKIRVRVSGELALRSETLLRA